MKRAKVKGFKTAKSIGGKKGKPKHPKKSTKKKNNKKRSVQASAKQVKGHPLKVRITGLKRASGNKNNNNNNTGNNNNRKGPDEFELCQSPPASQTASKNPRIPTSVKELRQLQKTVVGVSKKLMQAQNLMSAVALVQFNEDYN